ncbi:cell division protein FtsL [Thalassolituus sp.]|jgi:cell division protein FtsL|uniref:cell division protein FtsL n=1 Tax=Thalassolituus sp. TaxID=2030822 RepID=UPI00261D9C78|nr:cell division protein FtsL [uncultured Thalassolituus sp.]TNC92035.1 MAG: cell division protein FtsL [Thalassolituus sp.]
MSVLQGLLWSLVIISAVAQVSIVSWHRDLLQEWQKADRLRQELLQEQTRLVLEKSTLTAHGRIDTLARKRLGMKDPDHTQVFR